MLLDSLRLQGEGNCATVERLYQRLRRYVPQITRQYKRVAQTPYGVIEPPSKNHLILLPRQATLTDVIALKNDALTAELARDSKTAKRFWIRVLMVSPGDPEAIEGIERLSRGNISSVVEPQSPAPAASATARAAIPTKAAPTSSKPLTSAKPKSSQPSKPTVVQPSRSSHPAQEPVRGASKSQHQVMPIAGNVNSLFALGDNRVSRRRTLQLLGFAGGSVSTLLLGRAAIKLRTPALTAADFNPITFETAIVNEKGETIGPETKKAQVFQEKIGETLLNLMPIPGGTFMMGSPDGEGEDNERPQHEVTVPPFLMGSYEVTQAQWKAVVALQKTERDLEGAPSTFPGDDLPVEQVSWDDAVEFCNRLSRYSGREYRLSSEAEWEYACRAGTTTSSYFGERLSSGVANYRSEKTTDVGSFPANAFGLYDMHGNVWEWCQGLLA